MTQQADAQQSIPEETVIRIPEDCEHPATYVGKKIGWKIAELVEKWSEDNPFVVHAKTTQGTGKTLGAMETFHYHAGPTAVFGPRHSDVKADRDRTEFDSVFEVHFEGKDRACIHPQYKGKHFGVHPDISRNWCRGCEYQDACTFWTAYDILNATAQSFTAVHHHLLYLPEALDGWQGIESVVIDESPWDAIIEETNTFTKSEIEQSWHVVNDLTLQDDPPVDESLLTPIESALDSLLEAVEKDPSRAGEVFRTWCEVYEKCAEEEAINRTTKAISERHEEISQPGHTEVVRLLFQAIPHIRAAWDRAESNEWMLPMDDAPSWFWDISDEGLHIRWIRTNTIRAVARNKPVAVLATEMPTPVVEAIFDLPVVTITDELAPQVDVLQLETRTAGITALKENSRMMSNMLELTELAIQRERLDGNQTFVAVKEGIQEQVKKYLEQQGFEKGDDFLIGHYYGLTGSNRFEECDAVVLFGKPQLRRQDAFARSLLTGVDTKIFHDEKCEGELRDALHRIRPARKDGVRAYIWTSEVDLEDEFTGDYDSLSVPELRDRLERTINQKEESREIRNAILEFVERRETPPTATEFKDELPWSYSKIKKHREALVEEGMLEKRDESNGSGRPTKRYTVLGPENN